MKGAIPYLFFNGNCREAMEFYQKCFGGKVEFMRYGDHDESYSDAMKDQMMHASLTSGEMILLASDSPMEKVTVGSNLQINANCETTEELERVFNALATGGNVTMPLADQFWGDRFGCVQDRFGVQWMMACSLK